MAELSKELDVLRALRGTGGLRGNVSPELAARSKSWQPACREVAWSLGLPRPQPGAAPERLLLGLSAWCVPQSPPSADFLPPAMADELSDLLREFDEVMEDFDRGAACQYQQHLEELKRKAGHSVYDSGIDELESESRGWGMRSPGGGWCPSGWSCFGSSGVPPW